MKELNNSLLLTINGWAGHISFLDGFMVFSAKYLIFIVFGVAVACLGYHVYKREWRPLAYSAAALLVAFAVLQLVALINFDHRPFMDFHLTQLLVHEPGKSFPSDHTTAGMTLALAVVCFTRFKAVGSILIAAALLIGFSRVFVGVHYPADIVAGIVTALLGIGLVALANYFIEPRPRAKISFSDT